MSETDIITRVVEALDKGGSVALLFCVYFIWRASDRLARIEKSLEIYLQLLTGSDINGFYEETQAASGSSSPRRRKQDDARRASPR